MFYKDELFWHTSSSAGSGLWYTWVYHLLKPEICLIIFLFHCSFFILLPKRKQLVKMMKKCKRRNDQYFFGKGHNSCTKRSEIVLSVSIQEWCIIMVILMFRYRTITSGHWFIDYKFHYWALVHRLQISLVDIGSQITNFHMKKVKFLSTKDLFF